MGKCRELNCKNESIQDSMYCLDHEYLHMGGNLGRNTLKDSRPFIDRFNIPNMESIRKLDDKKIAQLQKDSFPTDSFWLYQLQVIKRDGSTELQFALPNDYANQDTSSEIIFYDIIVGDSIYERGFLGCSVIITKRMFFSFEDIHMLPNLTVVDNVVDSGKQYVRASRVLRSLPGIRNTVPINKKG